MDIKLHVGAHRTATTTFQTYLEDNRKILDFAGIGVWTPRQTRDGLFHGLFGQPGSRSREGIRAARRSTGLIKIERQRLAMMGLRSLVISEENALGAMRHNLRETALYPQAYARLARWKAGLQDSVTHIGLGIRSYDSYWTSALTFAVAHGQRVPDAARCGRLVTQPRRWSDMIRDIARTFPKAEICVWDYDTHAADPHQQLGYLTGRITPAERLMIFKSHHRNARVDAQSLQHKVAARGGQAGLIPTDASVWNPFSDTQRATLRDHYAQDLAWLDAGADGLATFKQPAEAVSPSRQDHTEVTGTARRATRARRSLSGGQNGTQRHMV